MDCHRVRFVLAEKGINVGDEWAYRSYIEGGSLESALGLASLPGVDWLRLERYIELQQLDTYGYECEFGSSSGHIATG